MPNCKAWINAAVRRRQTGVAARLRFGEKKGTARDDRQGAFVFQRFPQAGQDSATRSGFACSTTATLSKHLGHTSPVFFGGAGFTMRAILALGVGRQAGRATVFRLVISSGAAVLYRKVR